ncbi:MAG: phosphatidylglycerophosphatase A [Rhodospirillales bacterium]|nr:phosphatidylglycerophosphatase A [Rhodospirillales bacterium]
MKRVTQLQIKSPSFWIATGLGSGLMRPAPGTWGTLSALPFGAGLLITGGPPLLLCAIIALSPIAFWSVRRYQTLTDTAATDPSEIVIDEFLGMWIALLAALPDMVSVSCAFVFFRLFDILKPWPVSYFDKNWKGPSGIIADDIMAGIYAALCLGGVHYAGLI